MPENQKTETENKQQAALLLVRGRLRGRGTSVDQQQHPAGR
jgi:hypothetical protein